MIEPYRGFVITELPPTVVNKGGQVIVVKRLQGRNRKGHVITGDDIQDLHRLIDEYIKTQEEWPSV
jgi:hypothetical protein